MAIVGVIAGDEVIQVRAFERLSLQSELNVGTEVVNPQALGPVGFAGRLAVEEQDICFDALRVEDAGG